jgi:hypothetical protein
LIFGLDLEKAFIKLEPCRLSAGGLGVDSLLEVLPLSAGLGFVFSLPLPKKSFAVADFNFDSSFLGGAGFDSAGLAFADSDLGSVGAATTGGGGLLAERRLAFGFVIVPYLTFVSKGSSEAHNSASCLVTSDSTCKSFSELGSRLYMCIELISSYSACIPRELC